MRIVLSQLTIAVVVYLSFMLQKFVVFPVEQIFLPADDLYFASLLFIPHGIKLILAFVIGATALPGILIGQFLVGLAWGTPLGLALVTATIGALSVTLPVLIIRYSQGIAATKSLMDTPHKLSVARSFILVALIASLTNSLFHGILFHDQGSNLLELRYLIGDLLGAAVVLFLLIGARRLFSLSGTIRGVE